MRKIMNVTEIAVSDVDVPFGRKPRGDFSRLVTSIDTIGLLHPITVVPARIIRDSIAGEGYRLVAGLHRLAAHKELEIETISAEAFEADDLKERLIEIDENLARVGLSVIDKGEQHEERQQLAEALGLVRKVGNPNLNSDTMSELDESYTDQAATAIKESPRSVRRKIQIARDMPWLQVGAFFWGWC